MSIDSLQLTTVTAINTPLANIEADAVGTATQLAKVSQALDVSRTVATHVIDLLSKVSS